MKRGFRGEVKDPNISTEKKTKNKNKNKTQNIFDYEIWCNCEKLEKL